MSDRNTASEGSRIVETRRSRVAIVEPWSAGQYDPPMQDWLRLPAADSCPDDPTHKEWGTANPCGYFLVRRCQVCNAKFRSEVTPHMIAEVVGALVGTHRRFVREFLDRGPIATSTGTRERRQGGVT